MKKFISLSLIAASAIFLVGTGPIAAEAATGYTAAQVATHNNVNDCWLIISGQVYNVTNFIPIHPGGTAIVPYCGTDATTIFNALHDQTAMNMLPTYLIGTLITDLAAPTNVVGTPSQDSIALTWTASTGGVAPISYTILRNGADVGNSSTTSFTDTGLLSNTAYSYVIMAVDSNTPASNTVSSTAVSVTTLTAPTAVVGTPSQTSVALTWTASTGGIAPITYTVMRNGTSVGTLTASSFNDTGLTPATAYSYVITAKDSATPTASTASSTAISVTTLSSTTSTITAPSNVKAVANKQGVILTWTASTGGVTPVTYSIIRNGVTVGETKSTEFFDNWNFTSSTSYSYVITATDSSTPAVTASSTAISVTVGSKGKGGGDDDNRNGSGNNNGNNDDGSSEASQSSNSSLNNNATLHQQNITSGSNNQKNSHTIINQRSNQNRDN